MNVAPTTAAAGTCGACSSLLVAGQRYCIACGERRGELPFRVPERGDPPPSPPMLRSRRSFGAVGAVVLASGVLIGAAVGPAITPSSLASTAGQLIVVATGGAPTGPVTSAGGTGSAPTAVGGLAAPTGDVAKPPPVVVNRGGGQAQAQPAAPAAPAVPSAPAKTAPPPPPAAPVPTAPDPDPTISGTVVHLSHDGHGYAIATKDGQLLALHAKKAPATLGDKLKVTVHALDNGAFRERSTKALGHADVATFAGTVTFTDAQAGVYTVSVRGVSLLVHLPAPADPLAPAPQPPALGVQTTVDVTFPPVLDPAAPPQLQEAKRVDGDPSIGELDLEAIVRDPGPDPTQLIVSADDAGESASTLALKVPPKVDVSTLKPGTVISALVKREADGSLTLVSAAAD